MQENPKEMIDDAQYTESTTENLETIEQGENSEKKSDVGIAVITMVIAIVGLFLLGAVLGITSIYMAKDEIKSKNRTVKALGIITLIIGVVDIVGWLVARYYLN